MKTKNCFRDTNIVSSRNNDVDSLLPEYQKDSPDQDLTNYPFAVSARLGQFLSKIISYQGDKVSELNDALKASFVPTSLVFIDDLIKRSSNEENVCLSQGYIINFFLVEDKNGNFVVLSVNRDEEYIFSVNVFHLDDDIQWGEGGCFFLSKLTPPR